jgi:transcription initiation factor TFIIIB Brf1 subunit/transcription initiation factor TFIIB
MQALGEYLRIETKQDIASRYEKLFSSALDSVEEMMIEKMRKMNMSLPQIGKGIQMWLEYRITIGRRPLRIPKPELWAAALMYAIIKVNFIEMKRQKIAKLFKVSEKSLTEKYDELVDTLDIMPADYRYFVGEKNPLDKLLEAAKLLEDLDRQFKAD